MLTAGTVLKKARERKKYSLEEVSAATKIQARYLQALEEDKFDKFPSKVYAKGFLQNYANFLELDVDRILALYRRSVGEPTEKGEVVKAAQQPIKQPKFILTPSIVIISVVVLVAIATISYLVYQFYQFQKPPMLEITYPPENTTVTEAEITLKGKTEEDMFVTVNDEPVRISSDGSFEVDLVLDKGTNVIIVKSRHPDNVGQEAVVTRNIEYNAPEEEAPEEGDETSEEVPEEEATPGITEIILDLKITPEAAWIEVEIDGEQVLAQVVQPGSEYNYTASESIYVRTGKVSSTQITINGESQNLIIDSGGVASVLCEFDESNQIDCHQP